MGNSHEDGNIPTATLSLEVGFDRLREQQLRSLLRIFVGRHELGVGEAEVGCLVGHHRHASEALTEFI